MRTRRPARSEPMAAVIELRYAVKPGLSCCTLDAACDASATLLVIIDGEWQGGASCDDPDHIGSTIMRSLAMANWTPRQEEPKASCPTADAEGRR